MFSDVNDYLIYKERVINFVMLRNKRIREFADKKNNI